MHLKKCGSVSVHILKNIGLRAHHPSAHGGLSANVLLDINFFEMILPSCLKLCLTVEHSISYSCSWGKLCPNVLDECLICRN